MNKLSEDRLMLEFTYLAYSYSLWCRWTDKLLAYFLNFLLSYLSFELPFRVCFASFDPGLLNNLNTLMSFKILIYSFII